jgi:hypothetical protein
MVLASWFKMGFVPVEEALQFFREKATQRGKGNQKEVVIEN